MTTKVFIGIGFLVNALVGPLCMALTVSAQEYSPQQNTHIEQSSDCPHCSHGADEAEPTSTQDCAGHCLAQAKTISTESSVFTGNDTGEFSVIDAVVFFEEFHMPVFFSPVSSPPASFSVTTTVLRL
jgi:hypothetical protein